jgi:hypothetical protein
MVDGSGLDTISTAQEPAAIANLCVPRRLLSRVESNLGLSVESYRRLPSGDVLPTEVRVVELRIDQAAKHGLQLRLN